MALDEWRAVIIIDEFAVLLMTARDGPRAGIVAIAAFQFESALKRHADTAKRLAIVKADAEIAKLSEIVSHRIVSRERGGMPLSNDANVENVYVAVKLCL